ncbi:MAG: IS5 family transposase [Myxococcota bacterium]
MMGVDETIQRIVQSTGAVLGRRNRGGDVRLFVEGVFWILRTGAPWRDLPSKFGRWNSVFRRFRRWACVGRWRQMAEEIRRAEEPEEIFLLDSLIVKAHPDSAGARGSTASAEALGRSRGGRTTKVHAVVPTRGRWVGFDLTPGQGADISQAVPLLSRMPVPKARVADRAYDSDRFLAWLSKHDIEGVIPARRGRPIPRPHNRARYGLRNVIERFFWRLQRFRRIGCRTDKTGLSFGAFVGLSALTVERTAWP